MDLLTRGIDPLGGVAETTSPKPKIGTVPDWIYSEWGAANKEVRHSKALYAEDVSDQPPTDEKNWDIPDHEISKLQMLFPNAVKRVKT